MWFTMKLAWRNIFRNKRRTIIAGIAIGIGLADVTTTRLIKKIDPEATRVNCLTGHSPELGRIPIGFETDHEPLITLAKMRGVDPDRLKILWIRSTLDLERCLASTAYLDEIKEREDLELLDHPSPLQFDDDQNLLSPLDPGGPS